MSNLVMLLLHNVVSFRVVVYYSYAIGVNIHHIGKTKLQMLLGAGDEVKPRALTCYSSERWLGLLNHFCPLYIRG